MVFKLLHFSPFFFLSCKVSRFSSSCFLSRMKRWSSRKMILRFFCSRSFFHPRRIPSNICLHLFVFCDDLLLIEFPPQPPRKQIFKSLSVCLSVLRHYVLIHTQEHPHTSTHTKTNTHTQKHKHTLTC